MNYNDKQVDIIKELSQAAIHLGLIPKNVVNEMVLTLKTAEPEQPKERFLTKKSVAELLDVHLLTVHRLIQSGKIKSIKIGSAVRIKESSLNNYLESACDNDPLEEQEKWREAVISLKMKYKKLLRTTDDMIGCFKIDFGGLGCCDALVDFYRTDLKRMEKDFIADYKLFQ